MQQQPLPTYARRSDSEIIFVGCFGVPMENPVYTLHSPGAF